MLYLLTLRYAAVDHELNDFEFKRYLDHYKYWG